MPDNTTIDNNNNNNNNNNDNRADWEAEGLDSTGSFEPSETMLHGSFPAEVGKIIENCADYRIECTLQSTIDLCVTVTGHDHRGQLHAERYWICSEWSHYYHLGGFLQRLWEEAAESRAVQDLGNDEEQLEELRHRTFIQGAALAQFAIEPELGEPNAALAARRKERRDAHKRN